MTIPEDENKPQPPEGGNTAGAVPPVPEPTEPAPSSEVPPAAPVTPPPAAPAGGFPPAPPAPAAGSVPPPPGAFPAYAAAPQEPVAAPTRIPSTVNAAFWLYVASAVLSVIGGIVTIATAPGSKGAIIRQLQTSRANLNGQSLDQIANAAVSVAIGVSIVTLIFWAITFVLFAFFMRRGANWARIVLTVLTVLSLFNIIPGFPFGLLQVLASIVAVILIWLRPSSAWFAAIKASKAPRA
ncbi:hypothetical protein [Leifsonia shinshuensis]|uniref:DUF4064 domain-containing protein n=1 Tax=Leifsonia shinshuensis TaxID=150026 RepID=A0A853CMV4_9MICO|nr:hypothetical protein [Leifsonia shinshuensis]NYJ22176.1 hypothetical protein [Leifsonia shinshuensis]